MRRRIQIQPDDIAHLLHQQRVGRQFERLAPMRLQAEGVPDAADGHAIQADRLRHVPDTPVCRATRRRFQCANGHLLDLLVRDRARGPWPRFVIQPVEPTLHEATSPLADRRGRRMEAPGHDLAVAALGTGQDDAPVAPRAAPTATDGPAPPVVAVRHPSRSTQLWDVPFACSPPCRAVRAGRAICFTFYCHATSVKLRLKPTRNRVEARDRAV